MLMVLALLFVPPVTKAIDAAAARVYGAEQP
jgi:hypothetical protein